MQKGGNMISVSIFNDQISETLEKSLISIKQWGFDRVDLRERIFGDSVIDMINDLQRDLLVELLSTYPLSVGCLGTRRLVVRPEGLPSQINILDQLIKTALAVRTSYIRICTEERTTDMTARHARSRAAVANFRVLCDLAGEHGITLVLENKPTSITNRGSELSEMVAAVGRKNLQVVWDAVNSWQGGFDDVTADYVAIKDMIGIVHLRGAIATPNDPHVFGSSEVLGDDTFPNRAIVDWLVQDHFAGQITLDLSLGQIERYQNKTLSGADISRISLKRMTTMVREAINNSQKR
jgi:sugar phosphate isomerase/epimerase